MNKNKILLLCNLHFNREEDSKSIDSARCVGYRMVPSSEERARQVEWTPGHGNDGNLNKGTGDDLDGKT